MVKQTTHRIKTNQKRLVPKAQKENNTDNGRSLPLSSLSLFTLFTSRLVSGFLFSQKIFHQFFFSEMLCSSETNALRLHSFYQKYISNWNCAIVHLVHFLCCSFQVAFLYIICSFHFMFFFLFFSFVRPSVVFRSVCSLSSILFLFSEHRTHSCS